MLVPEWSGGIAVHVGSEPSSVPLPPHPAPVSGMIYKSQRHKIRFNASIISLHQAFAIHTRKHTLGQKLRLTCASAWTPVRLRSCLESWRRQTDPSFLSVPEELWREKKEKEKRESIKL